MVNKKTQKKAPKELSKESYVESPVVTLTKKELKRKMTDEAKSKLNKEEK